jgi:hypothetical protein
MVLFRQSDKGEAPWACLVAPLDFHRTGLSSVGPSRRDPLSALIAADISGRSNAPPPPLTPSIIPSRDNAGWWCLVATW